MLLVCDSLSQFPQISLSSFAADMQLLLDEADPLDSVHDVLVKVGQLAVVVKLVCFDVCLLLGWRVT